MTAGCDRPQAICSSMPRDRPAGGGLRALAGRLLRGPDGRGAIRAIVELDADAALDLGPGRGHDEEQRGDGEDGGDGIEGRALHRAAAFCGLRNCAFSVDPSIAVTDDCPPVAIWVISSK